MTHSQSPQGETERIASQIDPRAIEALRIISDAKAQAWIVGGFVRDALIGRPVHDFDIASSLPAGKCAEVFEHAGCHVIPTGLAHGTITAILDGLHLEITTYRTESRYSDSRHPDSVSMATCIEEDLKRRDFTMNALAFHPDRGILDPFGGLQDIHDGLIRAVGNPDERFTEDPLRILRACRFASQLSFAIEPKTRDSARYCKRYLYKVSSERIAAELDGMLCGPNIQEVLEAHCDILAAALPEIVACVGFDQHNPHHIYPVWNHIARVVGATKPDSVTRWAALLHDMGKPASYLECTDPDGSPHGHFYGHAHLSVMIGGQILDRLHMPRIFAKEVLELVLHHDDQIEPTHRAVKRMLAKLGGSTGQFERLVDIKRADAKAQHPSAYPRVYAAGHLLDLLAEIEALDEAFSLHQLAIGGRDLIEAGIPEGPRIGQLLGECLEAVISEEVGNTHEALIAFCLSR